MHGGTNPGAPKGNKNAFKHGNRTAEAEAQLKLVRQTNRDLRILNKLRRGVDLSSKELDRLMQLRRDLHRDGKHTDTAEVSSN
jgi:hypothetical protein